MIDRFITRVLDLFVFAVLVMFGLSLAGGLVQHGCTSVSREAGSTLSNAGLGFGVLVWLAVLCVLIGFIARLGRGANEPLGPRDDHGRTRSRSRYRAEDVPQPWAAAEIDDDPVFRV